MNRYFIQIAGCVLLSSALLPFQVAAEDLEVGITKDKQYAFVDYDNDLVKVQRIQDTSHVIDGSYAKTSRPCPPFCVNPIKIADGVNTVGEIELIKFMETSYALGHGVIIDARTPSWFKKGTIPGSVNIPFTMFERPADDPELAAVLEQLGAVNHESAGSITRTLEKLGLFNGDEKTDQWDFSNAKELLLWCNGPWCGQSPRAIHGLISLGYPAEKLMYYRGGMQMWQSLGFTTVIPKAESTFASK